LRTHGLGYLVDLGLLDEPEPCLRETADSDHKKRGTFSRES